MTLKIINWERLIQKQTNNSTDMFFFIQASPDSYNIITFMSKNIFIYHRNNIISRENKIYL